MSGRILPLNFVVATKQNDFHTDTKLPILYFTGWPVVSFAANG